MVSKVGIEGADGEGKQLSVVRSTYRPLSWGGGRGDGIGMYVWVAETRWLRAANVAQSGYICYIVHTHQALLNV